MQALLKSVRPPGKLSILIIESDICVAAALEIIIQKAGYCVHAITANAAKAMEKLLPDMPDFVVINVKIKGEENIRKIIHLEAFTILLDASHDTVSDSCMQQTDTTHYLMQPISVENLRNAMHRILVRKSEQCLGSRKRGVLIRKNMLYIKVQHTYIKVQMNAIGYIRADGERTHIYTVQREKHTIFVRLNELNTILPHQRFLRIHRSFIINLAKIDAVKASGSHLWIGTAMLPISRQLKSNVLSRLNVIR